MKRGDEKERECHDPIPRVNGPPAELTPFEVSLVFLINTDGLRDKATCSILV
jgi:hypothetical protein